MADNETFNQKIIAAADDREEWFNTTELPKIQEDYRIHLSCVRNIFDNLVKRSLIVPDPYKNDSKITEITLPETDVFEDNKRATVLGIRLSNYETMVDFVCNYMKFSVSSLSNEKIRRLLELNAVFTWSNLSPNSTKPNTKALAVVINELKNGAAQLTLSLLKDSIVKTQSAMEEINTVLKSLADFHRERYKIEIRRKLFENQQFDAKAFASSGALLSEIKRLFPSCMGKRTFSNELIAELIAEETSPDKEQMQKALYERIKVKESVEETKKVTVDTHAILMDALRILGSTCDQYGIILEKISANHEILQSERKSFKDKFAKVLRNIFGLKEPPVDYEVLIVDKRTETKRKEIIHFNQFTAGLSKRVKIYASFSSQSAGGYARINAQKDSAILDYLNKQSAENNHVFAQLVALDEFFKKSANPSDRSKIKGIGMELTTIRNLIVKSGQLRSEYVSYVEEQEQMKKLGI